MGKYLRRFKRGFSPVKAPDEGDVAARHIRIKVTRTGVILYITSLRPGDIFCEMSQLSILVDLRSLRTT